MDSLTNLYKIDCVCVCECVCLVEVFFVVAHAEISGRNIYYSAGT